MRGMNAVIWCLSASVLLLFVSYSYGEPVRQPGISFSLPYPCSKEESDKTTGTGICLADSFRSGLKVVLVGEKGNCSAKTANTFKDQHIAYEFTATRLLVAAGCSATKAVKESIGRFTGSYIAAVGADAAAVRLVSLKDDKSPVAKEMELKARKLADRHTKGKFRKPHYPTSISDAQPKVFRTENVTLLTFDLQVTYDSEKGPTPWEPGPTVALTHAGIFLLEGACTYGKPRFLSVNDRLYLTYHATVACCGCGDMNFFVYDLSSGIPKRVYQNSNFSD